MKEVIIRILYSFLKVQNNTAQNTVTYSRDEVMLTNLSGIGLSSGRLICSSVSLGKGTKTRGLSGVGNGTLHIKCEISLQNKTSSGLILVIASRKKN